MKCPETDPDIEIVHSLHRANHLAHWSFKNGRHRITLNLEENWANAVYCFDRARGARTYLTDDYLNECAGWDSYIEAFLDHLTESFLVELVCIERRRQGLRMKHDRCKPCCLAKVVWQMIRHTHISRMNECPPPFREA